MRHIEHPAVASVFAEYPAHIRDKLMDLRRLILETASEAVGVGVVEECLKWGEPSYLAKGGSAVRLGWKKSKPPRYAIYFYCRTRLVDTFKELYGDKFVFEGNRAILFDENEEIPIEELKHCLLLALTCHHRKHLAMLGV